LSFKAWQVARDQVICATGFGSGELQGILEILPSQAKGAFYVRAAQRQD
jgi:hypothetical protein